MIPHSFFQRDPVVVAKGLLGKVLCVRQPDGKILRAKIVETEAYYGEKDPASHASRGRTQRNEPMWQAGGRTYVYFTYGMHYLLNFVTGKEGEASAVLIRAVEPLNFSARTSGPALLTKAMRIGREHNNLLLGEKIWVEDGEQIPEEQIGVNKRIGVKDESPLRFFIKKNKFVSRG